jgi:hypothetical protein
MIAKNNDDRGEGVVRKFSQPLIQSGAAER